MLTFVIRRVAQIIPLLVVVSLLVFALIHAAPGGPLSLYLDNPNVRPQDIERLRRQMGLDQPLVAQYVSWVTAFARGDWGFSYADGRPVAARILERVPRRCSSSGSRRCLPVVVSLVVGVASAVRQGVDRAATIATVCRNLAPVFGSGSCSSCCSPTRCTGCLHRAGASFAGGGLGDRAAHLVLPVIVLAARTPPDGLAISEARCAARSSSRSSAPLARAV
jgi:peptide/nickel transport system permease protein